MNEPLFLTLVVFFGFAVAFWFVGYHVYVRPGRMRERIGEPVMAGYAGHERAVPVLDQLSGMFQKLGKMLPLGRSAAVVQQQLIMAGYRTESAPQIFLGLRAAAMVLFAVGGAVVPVGDNANPAIQGLFLIGGVGIGWRIPIFILKKRIAARQERLRIALPDALDLIVIAVEAGLGLDQAISHVAHQLTDGEYRDLSQELQLIGMEMRAGMRRADALRSLGARTGEEEIQRLAAILIQSDKFGTSMGEAIRSHSQYLRGQRRMQADERASKVGVKLVFPIFFFVLPSMMLVAAGPGLLQIFKYLFPLMKQIR